MNRIGTFAASSPHERSEMRGEMSQISRILSSGRTRWLIRAYLLERAQDKKEKFEFPVKWGTDLQSEHERYLTERYAKKPVIVMNYPKDWRSPTQACSSAIASASKSCGVAAASSTHSRSSGPPLMTSMASLPCSYS